MRYRLGSSNRGANDLIDSSSRDGPERRVSGIRDAGMEWANLDANRMILSAIMPGREVVLLWGESSKSAFATAPNASVSAPSNVPLRDCTHWSIRCRAEHKTAAGVEPLRISACSMDILGIYCWLKFETLLLKSKASNYFMVGKQLLSGFVEENNLWTPERNASASGTTLFASRVYSINRPQHISPETTSPKQFISVWSAPKQFIGVWAAIWQRRIS